MSFGQAGGRTNGASNRHLRVVVDAGDDASAFVNGNMFAGTFQDAIVVQEYVVVPAPIVAKPKGSARGSSAVTALP